MKLEYLDNISDGGKYSGVVTDQLVRLYDFDKTQAKEFYEAIRLKIIDNGKSIDLAGLNFIELLNCNLTLRLTNQDTGITTIDKKNFFCDLTKTGYENMLYLLEPFCNDDANGYQWMYDIDNDIEFLFSPGGTW